MCNSHSDYLIVLDCEIIGQNGEEAHPFERTAVLNIEFKLDWTTPDLGENRREPSVVLIDRAGRNLSKPILNLDGGFHQHFPYLKKQYSYI